MITVRFCIALSIACWTSASDSESKAEVASSNNKMRQSVNRALAIASLCFWPPETLTPFSPTYVSYFSGQLSIKSCALASLQTLSNSS
mmetsp:Transcript_19074/g.32104  ORF Transcript_19074/g.32104 Transcript_19074/m.32104 type:complete len:88 (-) Transcript_19074:81-344(-)